MVSYHADKLKWVRTGLLVKLDLEGQGQSTPQNNKDLSQGVCIFCPKMAVRAWTGDKLCFTDKLGVDTHTQTDAGNDNAWRLKLASGKNIKAPHYWPPYSASNVASDSIAWRHHLEPLSLLGWSTTSRGIYKIIHTCTYIYTCIVLTRPYITTPYFDVINH